MKSELFYIREAEKMWWWLFLNPDKNKIDYIEIVKPEYAVHCACCDYYCDGTSEDCRNIKDEKCPLDYNGDCKASWSLCAGGHYCAWISANEYYDESQSRLHARCIHQRLHVYRCQLEKEEIR